MSFDKKYLLILVLFISINCFAQKKNEEKKHFHYSGRIEKLSENKAILIGSASSVSFNFTGNSCQINLKSVDSWQHHNWVSVELDGEYIGRIEIEKGEAKNYPIKTSKQSKTHTLTIYKATEATNGGILFDGSNLKTLEIQSKNKKKIEFIGDSITCGFGGDATEIPCGTGEWFDQHNAYLAYGPRVARQLDVDFLLSSVSGIGMYRNWNDQHQDEAIMPDVYQNLYLIKGDTKPFSVDFQPDVVSICLGTNDLSEGDGIKKRLPFSEEKYISNYIQFIEMIYKRYPKTRIAILNSPMVSGDRNTVFMKCLNTIKDHFKTDKTHKSIKIFEFKPMKPNGCNSHPSSSDHEIMAKEIAMFYKSILNNN